MTFGRAPVVPSACGVGVATTQLESLLVFYVLGGYWAVRTKPRKLAEQSDGVKATGVTKALTLSAGTEPIRPSELGVS